MQDTPLTVTQVALSDLVPDPDNARLHPENNLAAITGSLKMFRQVEPLVVRRANNVVIGGNGRLDAMRKLGWQSAAVTYVDCSDAEATALGLALNRTSDLARWDTAQLDTLLAEVSEAGLMADTIGFSEASLEQLVAEAQEATARDAAETQIGEQDIDETISEPPADPVTKLGDIWLCGPHRLMCGDSLNSAHCDALLEGRMPDLVFTDPPYGMSLDPHYDKMFTKDKTRSHNTGDRHKLIIGDDKKFDVTQVLQYFSSVKEIILWGADYYRDTIPIGGSWYVWDKRCDENMDKVVGNVFELAWSKTNHKREVARILWSGHLGMHDDDTLKRVHPTQKPVKLITWFFERVKGNVVCDVFAGSGSTLIACHQANRQCRAMELDPGYVDVILARFEKFTGIKPILERNIAAVNNEPTRSDT